MSRMNKEEFLTLLDEMSCTTAHNLAVDFGGDGKVVVLRWALPGSTQRTEKKVLFASQSPVMVKAAHAAFTEWFNA